MKVRILGIGFDDMGEGALVERVLGGGLVVVPSGPGLAKDLQRSKGYREALESAEVVVTDSGAMVLLWRLMGRGRVQRVSGLRLLQALLGAMRERGEAGRIYWVNPSEAEGRRNAAWLAAEGMAVGDGYSYVAPRYPAEGIADPELWERLRGLGERPRLIVLCIGGGVQERLGAWLRAQYREAGEVVPPIVCTGAAIGFMTGNQVNIPIWADRLYLGWIMRCVYEPRRFIPRYAQALRLIWLMLRYRDTLPPVRSGVGVEA